MFLSLFLISGAVLMYEMLLMRIFAITQWYHFAYMIISIALLGFGASGTLIALFRRPLLKHFPIAYRLCAALFSFSIIVSYFISQRNRFNPFEIVWDPRQSLYLVEYYLVLFVPFLLAALCVGLMFLRYTERIGLVYCCNLIGSGVGIVESVAGLYVAHPVLMLYVAVGLGIGGLLATRNSPPGPLSWKEKGSKNDGDMPAFSPSFRKRGDRGVSFLKHVGVYGLLAASVGLAIRYDPLDLRANLRISPYKGLPQARKFPEAEVLDELVSPLGVVQTVASPLIRHAPGISLNYGGDVPSQIGIFVDSGDAGGITAILEFAGEPPVPVGEHLEYLDFLTLSLAYHVRSPERVLVLGAGGGVDVLNALAHQAQAVDAVELNPQIIRLVRDQFSGLTAGLYSRPNVRLIQREARSYAASSPAVYDAVHISLLDAFTASSAGVYGLSETYLYTVEALQQYAARLAPGGILSITRWTKFPPRDNIKLFATAIAALEDAGIDNAGQHLIAIRSWAASTLLLSVTPFTPDEIGRARQFCDERWFDTAYFPGITAHDANRYHQLPSAEHFLAAQALLFGNRNDFYAAFPYYVRPARDDRPYFFHFFTWKHLPTLLRTMGRDWLPFIEWGYLVLLATLAQAVVISAILILLPLLVLPRRSRMPRVRTLTAGYFFCLGLGYLFLEMALIQKFTLFLAHPVYAVSGSIAAFLIFSGLGSLYFQHRSTRTGGRLLGPAVGGIVGFSIAYILLLPRLFAVFAGVGLLWKMTLTITCIAPLAFCMGVPFPFGLRRLHEGARELVPWAYGINGCASVLSSLLATCIAIPYGFRTVMLCASLLYVLAAGIMHRIRV